MGQHSLHLDWCTDPPFKDVGPPRPPGVAREERPRSDQAESSSLLKSTSWASFAHASWVISPECAAPSVDQCLPSLMAETARRVPSHINRGCRGPWLVNSSVEWMLANDIDRTRWTMSWARDSRHVLRRRAAQATRPGVPQDLQQTQTAVRLAKQAPCALEGACTPIT